MREQNRKQHSRIALLVTMLLVMLLACGCRTRITNNDSVNNVMYDEDGYLTESYEMRRDELGLSTAEKPLFTGVGSPEDESYDGDYYGGDSQALEDYEEEDYEDPEEDYEEPEKDTPASTTTPRTTSGTTGRTTTGNRVVRRKVTRPATGGTGTGTAQSSDIEVSLNPDGGTCKTKSIKVKKDGTYSGLSSVSRPTRSGYTFKGWYTQKNGKGSHITATTKVTRTVRHTLYAYWEKNDTSGDDEKKDEEKKTYTLTFDVNSPGDASASLSGDSKVTVTEGGTYSGLPSASCTGYDFEGWYTDAADGAGTKIENNGKVSITSDQTVYAHWKKDAVKYWTAGLNDVLNSIEKDDKVTYKKGSSGSGYLNDSGMREGSDSSYDYLICFGSMDDAAKMDNPDGKPVLVIPKDATKGSTSKEAQLLYKFKLLDYLYGLDADIISQAADELGVSESDIDDIEKYTPDPPSDEDEGGSDEGQ